MRAELVGVGVEAVERGVEDPRAEVRLDDLGDQLQAAGQAEIGVLGPALLLGRKLFQPAAGLIRGQGRAADESQKRVVAPPIDLAPARLRPVRAALFSDRCRRAEACSSRGSRPRGLRSSWSAQRLRHRPAADVQARRIVARLRGPGIEGPSQPAGLERRGDRCSSWPSPRSPSIGSASGRDWDNPPPARSPAVRFSRILAIPPIEGCKPISGVILCTWPGGSRSARRPRL